MWSCRPVLALLTMVLAVACGEGGSGPGVPADAMLSIVSGNHQVGRAGEALEPLTVLATDGSGAPLAGLEVEFEGVALPERGLQVGCASGRLRATGRTDGQGLAATAWTLGPCAGAKQVEARLIGGRARPVRFHLIAYPTDPGSRKPLCVLSFNDFHMHFEPWGTAEHPLGGLSRLAALLLDLRAANAAAGVATVILNAGDDFENTLFQEEPGAFEALLQTWDRVGVDFWQVGNHEYHFGIPFFTDRILSVRDSFADHGKGHPLVITFGNVDPSALFDHVASYAAVFETGFDDPLDRVLFQQTAMIEAGGIRVGVLGAVTDAAVYTQVPGDPMFLKVVGAASPDAQGLAFLDPDPREDPYIGQAIDDLHARGADIIVANSHAGLGFRDRVNIPPGKDEHIARHGLGPTSGRAVDLIVSGHSHLRLNHAIFLDNAAGGQTGIVQGEEGGKFVTRSDLMVDTETNTVKWVESILVQVDGSAGEDPETETLVRELTQSLDQRLPTRKTELARAETYLSSRERTVCGMGRLINSSFLSSMGEVDEELISFVIPSTYRTDIHPGGVDLDLAYQVLSMHKMDAEGINEDTIVSFAFSPGRYNISLMGLENTLKSDVTGLEYFVEAVHSLQDVLTDILPSAAGELSLEVVQFGRLSYVLDATAPAFSRVVPGSVLVDGVPPDADTVYRVAGAHSIVTTIARVMDSFISARDPVTDEVVEAVVIPDPETGEPFTDTGIKLYQSLEQYLADEVGAGAFIPGELTAVTGEVMRTVQPELTVNPVDIVHEPAGVGPGQGVTTTVRVRNIGETAVESATAALYLETTPWDRTDDPDGFEQLQGLPAGYTGSRQELGRDTTAVGAYPAVAEVSFEWTVPAGLPAGVYPIEVRISNVVGQGVDPNTSRAYSEFSSDNNRGRQRSRLLPVR